MTSFQEQQGELEDGELQETSVFDVSHPPPPTTTMWTASHRDERGGPVSSHLVPSYSHSFPPTTTTTTASSSFSSHHHPSRGRKRPPKRGMPRMTCPTSRTNNNNNNNNDGGTSFPPHVASIVGGMDPLGTNTTTTSMVNIGDQVIQVISSLLAQGFQVPMDWFQNPQIYQWLVEWVRQSKSAELATTNKSSWAPPPSSCETPSGWTLGTTKTMDDHKESPGESIGTNNNYSMNNKKNNHESYPSMMPTNPKKSRPYTKKIPKKPKKSRNWTIYTTPRKQQEDDNTKLENCPNEQPQEMTTHEQYQHTEPKKQSSTLEELRNQAKMALKSSVDNATRDVVNKASQELSSAKQQQVTNHEEKEPGKTTTSPKENPSSSSLVITVEDSESNHSASGGDEKNTSRSRWSTLEELRRRVQELEERKKQYLQKRAKSTEEEHKKKIAKSNHLFSDSTLPLSSTPTMTTTTPKEETQRKEEQDDHSEEAKAWMERLEREAARAWEEHDKSITEEIEARNKLIRMRTCEETARESSRILKELWKKSRMDIQQYARQANAMEKQIEQIEVQRRRSLAIAEKSQRKLERLRRWIAMESLMDKEIDFAHPSSLSIFWEPHLSSSSSRRPRSSYAYEKEEETTIQSNQVANIYSPSPMTRNSWKPWMSMFRCFPLLHEVTEDVQLMTWYNDISWDIEICRYDLHGSCSDPDCKFQHVDKYCHPSIHVVFKKIEKSCCTLFWLRYGMEPDEKRCQALKRTLHSLLYSTKHKEEEEETWRQYFRATIPQLVVEWLQSSFSSSEEKEEQSIAWTTTGEDHAMDDTWDYGKYSSLPSRYFFDTP